MKQGIIIYKHSLGLDVSKDKFSACLAQQDSQKAFRIEATRTFNNTAKGFEELFKWVNGKRRKAVACRVVMEATGVYYENLAYFLTAKSLAVSVELPNKTKAYAKSLKYKSKTDKLDARILAQYGLERDLPLWEPKGENMLLLKRLCRERVEVLQSKTATSNRLHAKKHAHQMDAKILDRCEKLLAMVDGLIKEIEEQIVQAAKADAEIWPKVQQMCSIKGVGIVTAVTIIAETNGFALFRSKGQVVSYAGYDVVEEQSGSSLQSPGRISKKGNAFIRRALHFPALTSIKHEPTLKALYNRVFEKTRVKMKASVAVQRKLLVLLYTLYKKNEVFNPQHAELTAKNRQKQIASA